jgi:hypothetical protein
MLQQEFLEPLALRPIEPSPWPGGPGSFLVESALEAADRNPPVSVAENGEPLENVEQLAYVAGPGVCRHGLDGFGGPAKIEPFARAEPREEKRNVTGSLPKRSDV